MNCKEIADDIIKIAAEPSVESQEDTTDKPEQKIIKTSVPAAEIHDARKIANFCKERLTSLLNDLNLKIDDLSGKTQPSVLSSKDAFKETYLALKNLKRKLTF